MLSRNHLVLLLGLLDRPDATALGRWDWVDVAMPHVDRQEGMQPTPRMVYDAIDWLPDAWVTRTRQGRYTAFRLTPHGRHILEGRVPARVSGRYPYVPGQAWDAGRGEGGTYA